LDGPVEPLRLANGNPHYELGQGYDSIRVQFLAIPTILFLDQQDLQAFVAPPNEYIPERQANLTIEDIPAAYTPPPNIPANSAEQPTSTVTHDDSKPRPIITRTEVNQALQALQLYIIQTAPSAAIPQDTASLMDSITTLTNRMWELNMKRTEQSQLEKCPGKWEGG